MSSTPAPSRVPEDHDTLLFYDGVVAIRRRPHLSITDDHFALHDGDATFGPYAWSDLSSLDAATGTTVFRHRDLPGWRLEFRGPPPPTFAALAAPRTIYGEWIDRLGLPRATIVLGVITVAVLLVVLRLPAWLTPLVPRGWENRLGDTMTREISRNSCHSPAGDAALQTLVRRIDGGHEARQVTVIDDPTVNAVTFPGGHVLLYRGLLDDAPLPDTVAGVIGHEIGHIHYRDGVTALIRAFGLSAALGGFNGSGGDYTRAILNLRYGREAEERADDWSRAALRAAAVDPRPTARFFANLAKREGDTTPTWLSTHPASLARSTHFLPPPGGAAYCPALDGKSWRALQTICAARR